MISSKLVLPATLTLVLGTCVLAAVPGGSNTYLPPNKGYDYPRPTVPFTPSTPGRPPYNPPNKPPSVPPYNPGRTPSVTPGPNPPSYTPPRPTPSRPVVPPYHPPGENHDHHNHVPGMPFDFAYAVNDVQTSNDYSHQAKSDGDVTHGEYRVQLPDGRTQIVRYTADWKTGYHAEVSYEGEARYPEGPSQFGGQNQGYKY